MIQEKDMLPIGRIQKLHGISGEMVILFHKATFFDLEVDFYFLDMDGIPVPFFVEEITSTSDTTARIKFMDVDNERSALRLVNKTVLLHRDKVKPFLGDDKSGWGYFIGFNVIDQHGVRLGVIREVDDSTINVLFTVVQEGKEILIPATEDFIISIDEKRKLINMDLPGGLLE